MRYSFLAAVLLAASVKLAFGSSEAQPSANVSPGPSPTPPRLQNISARAQVRTEQNVLIGGIIVSGSEPKNVIIRGLGPSLQVNGNAIQGTLTDPTLDLYAAGSSVPLAQNNDWKDTQAAEISATQLAPSRDAESAIVRTLDPGRYTAILRGRDGGTGIGLIEVYDLDTPSGTKLTNISSRGFVGTGDDVLIGGVIAGGGEASATVRVIIRALGPSLDTSGISGAIADPTLEIFDANGVSVGFNDNWRGPQESELVESGLAPDRDPESAIILQLVAGNYTAVLRGKGETTGTALLEVYDMPLALPQ